MEYIHMLKVILEEFSHKWKKGTHALSDIENK